MATFPSYSFSKDFIKVRFLDPAAPLSIAQRWLGMPRGVYIGFTPSGAGDLLTLSVDAANGFSLLKVGSESQKAQVDLFTDQPITLNFAGHTQFPVYVLAKANFPIGGTTRAEVFTRSTAASGAGEITICQVSKPADDLVVDVTAPSNRNTPIAFEGQAAGYMSANAIVDLSEADGLVTEIGNARTSPYTGAHPSLGERINDDLSGEEMSARLGLRSVNVTSNSHLGSNGSSVVNVSGSFTETGREFAPILTIESGGDESTEGAVVDPSRNSCFVINATTGERIVNSTNDEIVYGDLTYATGALGSGKVIQFFNAGTGIDGNGTNPFQAPIQEGDIILGPDGKYYEIESFTDPDNAVLGEAYQGATGSVSATTYRRFTLSLATISGGAYSLTDDTNIRALFTCFFSLNRAIFDGTLLIKKAGERPPVPIATETVNGKALLAAAGGLAGSVRTIKNNTASIGNDFHTLNFSAIGGAVNAGGGVANISIPGPPGPPGASSNEGPTGPSGAAGPGYGSNNSFESSSYSFTPTPSFISHTVDFSLTSPVITSIEHLYGGYSGLKWGNTSLKVQITSITRVSPTVGRIYGDLGPGVASPIAFKLFLGAMQ